MPVGGREVEEGVEGGAQQLVWERMEGEFLAKDNLST